MDYKKLADLSKQTDSKSGDYIVVVRNGVPTQVPVSSVKSLFDSQTVINGSDIKYNDKTIDTVLDSLSKQTQYEITDNKNYTLFAGAITNGSLVTTEAVNITWDYSGSAPNKVIIKYNDVVEEILGYKKSYSIPAGISSTYVYIYLVNDTITYELTYHIEVCNKMYLGSLSKTAAITASSIVELSNLPAMTYFPEGYRERYNIANATDEYITIAIPASYIALVSKVRFKIDKYECDFENVSTISINRTLASSNINITEDYSVYQFKDTTNLGDITLTTPGGIDNGN